MKEQIRPYEYPGNSSGTWSQVHTDLILLLLLTITAGIARAEPWWNPDWSHRIRVEVSNADSDKVDSKTAYLKFPTGGISQETGADFRVIGPGAKPAPYYLLNTNRATYSELFFQVTEPGTPPATETPDDRKQTYWIYFGNPKAEPEESNFRPTAGLTLHFYELGEFPVKHELLANSWRMNGRIEDYKTFADFTKTKGKELAAYQWPKIEFDRSDLVPRDHSLLVFHGKLNVPADGIYSFSIASDDAAAVVLRGKEFAGDLKKKTTRETEIDGLNIDVGDEDIEALFTEEELAAKPESAEKTILFFKGGRDTFSKTAHATVAHVGKIELKKGVKEMFFFQTVWKGLQFAGLAWSGPEIGAWTMLNQSHFIQPIQAVHAGFESQQNTKEASFEYEEVNSYLIDRHIYIEAEFSVMDSDIGVVYKWDFGDGVDGVEGTKVTHVYLAKGDFPVTLSVHENGNETSKFTRTVKLLGGHESAKNFRKTIARYSRILRDYPFAKLPTPYFEACMILFEKVYPDPSTLIKVLKAYVDTHTPLIEDGEAPGQILYYAMPGKNRINSKTYYSLRNDLANYYMRLGERQFDSALGDSKSAIATYNTLIDLFPEMHPSAVFEYSASPSREIARIHLQEERLEEANAAFKKLEENAREGLSRWYAKGGLGTDAERYRYWIRSAMIGQADVLLRKSELKPMAALCNETSKVQRRPMRPAIAAAKRASHRTTIEDLLRRDWPEEALDQLHLLEVEFPRNKMEGITEFLKAKAQFALRDFNETRKSLMLCLRLLDPKALENAEVRYVDAESLFQMDRRAEADAAFKKFIEVYPDSEFAVLARRRLELVSVIRLDIGMEGEPFLVEHTRFKSYPLVDHVDGYGGNYRAVHRWAALTYEIPIPASTERIRLRFRKKGVALVQINGKNFWQEPHIRRDEDVVDQELLIADQAEWANGKLKITFRDGLNYWPYWDPESLYVNWLELELLKLD